MKFYDRKTELNGLEKACAGQGAEMIVVSGRRRVGKTRLIDEFLKNKDHVKILIVPKEEKQVATDFATAFANGYTPSFNNVEQALEYFFNSCRKRILYVDEFPNLLDVSPSLPYVFQRVWEKYKNHSTKVLIFSGSYVSMMNKIFTRQKAPLFNRAGYQILLQPLPLKVIWEIQKDLGFNSTEKISNYCILGGLPFYYELIEKLGQEKVVNNLFFDVAAPLKEEGQNVLRQEFGTAYKKYFSIIEAIGAGLVSGSEIANKLGISQPTLSKYIMSLQRDFQLIERTVPFGQNPSRSKKGVYSIKDNTTAFWFTNVYGKPQPPSREELNEFISKRFETFCRDFFTEYLKSKNETVIRAGKWWGKIQVTSKKSEEREIDLVAETQNNVFIAECKWTNRKIPDSEIKHLEESSKALKTNKTITKVLFSKTGFDFKEPNRTMLFDPQKIEAQIHGFS